LEIATCAPHSPYSPAPRDAELFPGLKAPRTPAFAARPDANAPAWIRRLRPLGEDTISQIDHNYRMRAQSVQAVDKLIGDIRSQLVALGIAENTYIIFSSDNGYHMGEYSLGEGKMTPFDVDAKVPFVVVGPGVTKGHVESSFVGNIDLAPTFVELGYADALAQADGKSIVPLLRGVAPEEWRQTATIEHVQRSGPIDPEDPERLPENSWDPPTYQALRSKSALYVEYENGGISLYDLVTDPYQLRNIAGSASVADLARYRAAVAAVRTCKGSVACWSAQFSDPAAATPVDASARAAD
jgi:N-acetylglucosamine-6-sulfatase